MNLDDDFESSSWTRKDRYGGIYDDVNDDMLDESEPIVVVDESDSPKQGQRARLLWEAHEKREHLRRLGSSQSSIRFHEYDMDAYDLELEQPRQGFVHSNLTTSDVDIVEMDLDSGAISDRVQRIIASGSKDFHSFENAQQVPSYKPSRPLPGLDEAKEAFLHRVELKRLELKRHELGRLTAHKEREEIEAELQRLGCDLKLAKEHLFELEKTLA